MYNIDGPGFTVGPILTEADYPAAIQAMISGCRQFSGFITVEMENPSPARREHLAQLCRDAHARGELPIQTPSSLLFRPLNPRKRAALQAELPQFPEGSLPALFAADRHGEAAELIQQSDHPLREFRELFVATRTDPRWADRIVWYLDAVLMSPKCQSQTRAVPNALWELPAVTLRPSPLPPDPAEDPPAFFPTNQMPLADILAAGKPAEPTGEPADIAAAIAAAMSAVGPAATPEEREMAELEELTRPAAPAPKAPVPPLSSQPIRLGRPKPKYSSAG